MCSSLGTAGNISAAGSVCLSICLSGMLLFSLSSQFLNHEQTALFGDYLLYYVKVFPVNQFPKLTLQSISVDIEFCSMDI